MAMRWLKCSARCAAAAFALLACSTAASAQVPPDGYFFLEVLDEADKPVSGAATVVYDSSGKELESSATDSSGQAALFRNRYQTERFVFRVIKPDFLTYEGTFVTSGQYKREQIRIKLSPKPKADAVRRATTKRTSKPSLTTKLSECRVCPLEIHCGGP
jgi:hypothetical protein